MSEDTGQRRGKSKAVGQHVFRAGFAEVRTKVFVSVKDLAEDRLGGGRVHVALFH